MGTMSDFKKCRKPGKAATFAQRKLTKEQFSDVAHVMRAMGSFNRKTRRIAASLWETHCKAMKWGMTLAHEALTKIDMAPINSAEVQFRLLSRTGNL